MKWANGTSLVNNKLELELTNTTGEVYSTDIGEVLSLKIPSNESRYKSRAQTTDFDSWSTNMEFHEYCDAFAIPHHSELSSRHQLYEFRIDTTRYVVPALVLMQAIFKPNNRLLPLLFRPDQLGSISYIKTSTAGASTVLCSPWSNYNRINAELVSERLDWVNFYPSAKKMLHSVFQNALKGWLKLELPKAKIKMMCFGVRKDETLYVSGISIKELVPTEAPSVPVQQRYNEALENKKNSIDVSFLRPDNFRLSDYEWSEIEGNLLEKNKAITRHILNQKLIFEDILYRLITGTPWEKINYQTGNMLNATYAYGTWRKDGRLKAAIMKLRELRGHHQS